MQNDAELLEIFTFATLMKQGMESSPHAIVRHARECVEEVRKVQNQGNPD